MKRAIQQVGGLFCVIVFGLVAVAAATDDWRWHAVDAIVVSTLHEDELGAVLNDELRSNWAVGLHLMDSSVAFRARRFDTVAPLQSRFSFEPSSGRSDIGPVDEYVDRGFSVRWGQWMGFPWGSFSEAWIEWSVSTPYWFLMLLFGIPGGWWAYRKVRPRGGGTLSRPSPHRSDLRAVTNV